MLQPAFRLDLQTITISHSASKGDLVVPRTRLEFGERAFTVAASRLWNELRPISRRYQHWRHPETS